MEQLREAGISDLSAGEDAALTIGRICKSPEHLDAVVEAGAIAPLAEMRHIGGTKARSVAALALKNICASGVHADLVAEAGVDVLGLSRVLATYLNNNTTYTYGDLSDMNTPNDGLYGS